MRIVSWLLRLALFTAALLFAAANIKTNTELNVGVDLISAPLVLFLLVFFVAGVVIGLLAVVPTLFRQRREIGRLKQALKLSARPGSAAMPPLADAPSAGTHPS